MKYGFSNILSYICNDVLGMLNVLMMYAHEASHIALQVSIES